MSNEKINPAQLTPVLTPQVQEKTFGQFKVWLDGNIDKNIISRRNVLFGCAQLASDIPALGFFIANVPIQALATTMFGIKELPEIKYPLISLSETTILPDKIKAAKCVYVATGVEKDGFVLAGNAEEWEKEFFLYLNWKLNSDVQYQGDALHQIVNVLVLSGLESFDGVEADEAGVNGLFQRNLKISASDYFSILFSLWTFSSVKPKDLNGPNIFIRIDSYLSPLKHKGELRPLFASVLEELSFRVDEGLNSENLKFAASYSGQRIANAVFDRKPLMTVSDDCYLFAGYPFLKIQMTHKFLQKADSFARRETEAGETEFGNFVSGRLERFFHSLCGCWSTPEGRFPEYVYERKQNKKSTDCIVFEKDGDEDVVLLFEMKIKTLVGDVFYGASNETLQGEVEKYAKSVYQTVNYLYYLNEASQAGRLEESSRLLSERILRAPKCCIVGITPIDPGIFTSSKMRERLIEAVKRKTVSGAWDWFINKYGNGGNWNWHIMGLDQFEVFLSLPASERKFYRCFKKYIRESGVDTHPKNLEGNIAASFRDFLIQSYQMQNKYEEIPGVKEVFSRLKDRVKVFFKE